MITMNCPYLTSQLMPWCKLDGLIKCLSLNVRNLEIWEFLHVFLKLIEGFCSPWCDTQFKVDYNLVIIFVIMKYFWDSFVNVGKRYRTTLNPCVRYYFSYNIIFVVFLRSFVDVDNFICESIDYATSFNNGKLLSKFLNWITIISSPLSKNKNENINNSSFPRTPMHHHHLCDLHPWKSIKPHNPTHHHQLDPRLWTKIIVTPLILTHPNFDATTSIT